MRMPLAAAPLLALISTYPAIAAATRLGPEFQVNTYSTSTQMDPAVATGPSGDFVVVWSSLSQDGFFYGVFGQVFSSTGLPFGVEFQANTYTGFDQARPSIAANGSGGFVVVWDSYSQDGNHAGIFGLRLDSTGNRLGQEFQVNTYTTSYQYGPAVAAGASGEFVVAWIGGGNQDLNSRGIFAQRFDSDGTPAGGEFQVNTYVDDLQIDPAVAMDDSGAFVVAWQSNTQDGDSGGIFAQRFDSDGMPAGGEFQVNTYTTGNQANPAIATTPGGDFLVVWHGPRSGKFEIAARRYDSGGQALGEEFRVADSVPADQTDPAIAVEASGGFVVTWGEIGSDGSGSGIVGRRIGAGGSPVGIDFQVNSYTTGSQRFSAVGMNAAGDLTVAWQDASQDGSSIGIFGQRFQGRAPGLVSHVNGDTLDCSDPALIRPTFTWDPDGYDRFRVYLSSDPAFGKGSFVTSGDSLRPGTSWEPSTKKWRRACMKAIAVNPVTPEMFIRVLGKDTDLGKQEPARLRFSETVAGNVSP